MYRYFKQVSGFDSGNCSYFWKSKGLSDENISTPNASDHKLNLEFIMVLKQEWNLVEDV